MRIAYAAVACGLALATAVPAAAGAPAPPEGLPCRYEAVQTAALGEDVYNGELDGGPVVAPGGEPVSLTCAIHVNAPLHSDPSVASLTGPRLPGVGVLAPAAVSFRAGELDEVVVCTSATVGEVTWYWDGAAWSPDSGTACPPPHDDPYWPWSAVPWDLLMESLPVGRYPVCLASAVVGPGVTDCSPALMHDIAFVDSVVCAVIASAPDVPGVLEVRDGDLYLAGEFLWDCPPYGPL